MSNDALFTKDNMIRRNWKGTPECSFCDKDESIEHLFFKCSVAKVEWACIARCLGAVDIPGSLDQYWQWLNKWLPQGKKYHVLGVSAICWALWKARNKTCFDKKVIRNPIEIVCHAGALMKFWAGLYADLDKEALEDGVNTMLKVAYDTLTKKKSKVDPDEEDLEEKQGGGRRQL